MYPLFKMPKTFQWNIWTRPIRDNSLLSIMHEAGLMSAQLVTAFLLLGLILAEFISRCDGAFGATIFFVPLFGISGYILGTMFGLVVGLVGKLIPDFSNVAVYAGLSILALTALTSIFVPQWIDSNGVDADFGGLLFYTTFYIALYVLVGRFGVKLFEVRQLP